MIDAAYSIRHGLWATRRLLEYAASLPAEALQLRLAGTAGPVSEQLEHIVGAEARYLSRLGGPSPADAGPANLAAVLAQHESNERAWEAVLAGDPDLDAWVELSDGRVRRRVMVTQALTHGTDHRTQVGAILLGHRHRIPNLDAWAYARAQGDGEYPDEDWIDPAPESVTT